MSGNGSRRMKEIVERLNQRIEEEGIESQAIGEPIDDSSEIDDNDEYTAYSKNEEISFIELAILNSYFHGCYKGKHKDITITSYGHIENSQRMSFGGLFEITGSYWFLGKFANDDNEYIFQTRMFLDNRNELNTFFNISVKDGMNGNDFISLYKNVIKLAFNNSEYNGKVIKVKLRENCFKGIEILELDETKHKLILNSVQEKFIEHFITRVGKGGTARYLLNGQPGSGKTETIREIAKKLVPHVSFIIPDFSTSDDLTSILEACEIFERGVIIMDDIDLYLGSRDNGSYTRLLGQFLSFFDGVKKRKISLLASTNDKGLVDKAGQRPGRFNIVLDYSFLDDEQIEKVCNIHLPEKWRVKEVYDVLKTSIGGKKVNVTGAFIANLADNIREMSDCDENWTLENTLALIKESYKGFYNSQISLEKESLGFKVM